MGILERLLETDVEKLQKGESRKFEVKRLSEVFGEPFIVECHPLTHEQINHVGEISKNGSETRVNVVLEACTVEGRRFLDNAFLEKFGAVTGKTVVEKLLQPGELYEVYNAVNEASGYGKDAVEEVKN